MTILLLKTDSLTSELWVYEDEKMLSHESWEAHRTLSDTLLLKTKDILALTGRDWQSIEAVAVYEGPGSFTGLRIGHSFANACAYSLTIPVVTAGGNNWLQKALSLILKGEDQKVVAPFYGREARITTPRK